MEELVAELTDQGRPAELAADLDRLEFKPEHATHLGIASSRLGGRDQPVHRVHNFPVIFTAADKYLRRRPQHLDPIERVVFEEAPIYGYDTIFRDLKMMFPALYNRMSEVADNLREQRLLGEHGQDSPERAVRLASDEELADWADIASSAYGAAAGIARQMDEKYDLEFLYLGPR